MAAPSSSASSPPTVGYLRRQGAVRRAVGPRLGRPGRQRHPRPAARPDPRRPQRPPASSAPPPRVRGARPRLSSQALRAAPPDVAGRWFLLPERETDPTKRAHAVAESLLERHGVVTRGAVMSERTPGGFAAAYKVLSAFEDTGRCRRGYFVEGLGAAQFGTAGAIDRLRTHLARRATAPRSRPPSPSRRPTRPTRSAPRSPGRRRSPVTARAQGRRDRRARRRRAHPLRRARRQDAAHLLRRRGAARRAGSRRSGASYAKERSAGSPSRRPTAPASSARTPRCSDGRWSPPASSPLRADCGSVPRATGRSMPEGDTVYQAAAKRLDAGALTGPGADPKSDFRIPSLATSDLSGATVIETVSRGKHLLTRFDNGVTLHTHLKMEGTWAVHPLGIALATPGAHRPRRAAHGDHRGGRLPGAPRPGPHRRRRTTSSATSAPTCSAPTGTPTSPSRNLRADPDAPDRRRAARPAQPRRRRQRLQVRALLPRPRRPAAPRSAPSPTCPPSSTKAKALPRGQQGPLHPDHHRRPPPRLPALGLRPPRPLPALRHRDPQGRPRTTGPGAPDYWCPRCQPLP